MKKVFVSGFLIILFLNLNSKEIFGKSKSKSYILYNFADNKENQNTGWSVNTKSYDIYRWGRSMGLFLVDDASPFIDKKAVFVSPYGAEFKIKNLNKHKNYILWIDFVKYKGDKSKISSRLKILADKRILCDLSFGDLKGHGLFKLELPRDLVYDGSVLVRMEEYSDKTGFWGIWDMIVSSEKLPENISGSTEKPLQKNLKINEKLLQKKNLNPKKSIKSKKLKPVKNKTLPKGGDEKSLPANGKVKQSIIKVNKVKEQKKINKIPASVKKKVSDIKKRLSLKSKSADKKKTKKDIAEPQEPIAPKI